MPKKKFMKSRKKKSNSRKIFRNWEKYFRIKKTISESTKLFQNYEKCFRIEKYFVTRVEKKLWIQWPQIQWTSQLIFTCLKSTIETLENGVEYVPR